MPASNGPIRTARDGEELASASNGQGWIVSWHPPVSPPEGKPHGAAGFCVTSDGDVVLVSNDGYRWGLPAGRPEGDESWEDPLRREMLEEACATVVEARLLGFGRSRCVKGPEKGLVIVRSFWRAEVELGPWEPLFEIPHRRVVPMDEVWAVLNVSYENGLLDPIDLRVLQEAITDAQMG